MGSRLLCGGREGTAKKGWSGLFPRSSTEDLSEPFCLGQMLTACGHCHLLVTGCNSCITLWLNSPACPDYRRPVQSGRRLGNRAWGPLRLNQLTWSCKVSWEMRGQSQGPHTTIEVRKEAAVWGHGKDPASTPPLPYTSFVTLITLTCHPLAPCL